MESLHILVNETFEKMFSTDVNENLCFCAGRKLCDYNFKCP